MVRTMGSDNPLEQILLICIFELVGFLVIDALSEA